MYVYNVYIYIYLRVIAIGLVQNAGASDDNALEEPGFTWFTTRAFLFSWQCHK